MEIVVNKCFGGFSLSNEAKELYCSMLGIDKIYDFEINRTDDILISIVDKLKAKAFGMCAKLKIVEIPDNCTDWEMNEYDGIETITYVVDGKIYHA